MQMDPRSHLAVQSAPSTASGEALRPPGFRQSQAIAPGAFLAYVPLRRNRRVLVPKSLRGKGSSQRRV